MAGSKAKPRTTAKATTASVLGVDRESTIAEIQRSSRSALYVIETYLAEHCLACAGVLDALKRHATTHARGVGSITSTSPKPVSKRSAVKSGRARSGSG